ncbi:MAG: YceI family protein [Arenicella sp.]
MKKLLSTVAITLLLSSAQLFAAPINYQIDIKGAHASINFKIKHLGFSFLTGRFNSFSGTFIYDKETPENSEINITIDTNSVDSNHQKRDKHIRSEDFLFTEKFPEATFKSTSYTATNDTSGTLSGTLTLRGISKDISINITKIGEGNDPWGGHRVGFEGSTLLKLKDFGIPKYLGPQSETVELNLHIEGIREKKEQ